MPDGMHRIGNSSSGLEAEEDSNVVKVTGGIFGAEDISGSVLANSMNGKVTVSLNKVAPGKAMSFSAFNGGAISISSWIRRAIRRWSRTTVAIEGGTGCIWTAPYTAP